MTTSTRTRPSRESTRSASTKPKSGSRKQNAVVSDKNPKNSKKDEQKARGANSEPAAKVEDVAPTSSRMNGTSREKRASRTLPKIKDEDTHEKKNTSVASNIKVKRDPIGKVKVEEKGSVTSNGKRKVSESPISTEPTSKPKKAKNNSYGLTPGLSPFPDWKHPTPDEAQEVHNLLAKVHGEHQAPATLKPSTNSAGCGEVPSILDAMIRTLLSAATSDRNSSASFQGLISKFGLLKTGVGKGSVDWDKVRRADVKEVFEAIKSGGLAAVKSKNIKAILDSVYEENKLRRDQKSGIKNESGSDDEYVLSLDHLHDLDSDEAFKELVKYPGVGPKTASCVLLFCMRRPSFAVDTHVFRICKWLGWVPPDKATRNTTYSHCEVMIPDHLKYPLHKLFIKHGKTCPRCRAITGENSQGWEKGCVIDHLVNRTEKRKMSSPQKAQRPAVDQSPAKRKRNSAKYVEESETSSEEEIGLGSSDESGGETTSTDSEEDE